MLLKSERLWSVVSNRKPQPDGRSEDRPIRAQLEWDDKAERTTAMIFPCLTHSAERHVADFEGLVVELKEVYSTSGFSARCNIWQFQSYCRKDTIRFDELVPQLPDEHRGGKQ